MGPKAADARALAYRLFEIATKKGWAAEALVYNELAQEWPKLEDLAAERRVALRSAEPIDPGTFTLDEEHADVEPKRKRCGGFRTGCSICSGPHALRRGADEEGPWRKLAALRQPRRRLRPNAPLDAYGLAQDHDRQLARSVRRRVRPQRQAQGAQFRLDGAGSAQRHLASRDRRCRTTRRCATSTRCTSFSGW